MFKIRQNINSAYIFHNFETAKQTEFLKSGAVADDLVRIVQTGGTARLWE